MKRATALQCVFFLVLFVARERVFASIGSVLSYSPCEEPSSSWKYQTLCWSEPFCPMNDEPVKLLQQLLDARIVGQPIAKSVIVPALQTHLRYSPTKPRVFAFVGPTGTGKTETAHIIGDAIFKRRDPVGDTLRPRGMWTIDLSQYSDPTRASEYQEHLRALLFEYISKCPNAVILLDEFHRVAPKTLNVLLEPLGEHPVLHWHGREVDCSHAVFILCMNDHFQEIPLELLRHPSRDVLSPRQFEAALKREIDDVSAKLKFSGLIDIVIPFLPLERQHVMEISEKQLARLASEGVQKHYWSNLTWTPEVPWWLSGLVEYGLIEVDVDYTAADKANSTPATSSGTVFAEKRYARYGARSIVQKTLFEVAPAVDAALSEFNMFRQQRGNSPDAKATQQTPPKVEVELADLEATTSVWKVTVVGDGNAIGATVSRVYRCEAAICTANV